jgi:hypothetical protein
VEVPPGAGTGKALVIRGWPPSNHLMRVAFLRPKGQAPSYGAVTKRPEATVPLPESNTARYR